MSNDHAPIRTLSNGDELWLEALDPDGEVVCSAIQDGSRWGIYADDGLELPVAYVGDEAAARAWLDFISHLYLARAEVTP